MKFIYNYSNENYRYAKNYDGTNYYNYPMTVKLESGLFILPFGTSDKLTEKTSGEFLTIFAENKGLDYIGLVSIDNIIGEITQSVLLDNVSGEDFTRDIFDKDINEQLAIISNWFE